MGQEYKITFTGKEGLNYRDDCDVYRFDVALIDNIWKVFLPGSRGEFFREYELSDEERVIIIPRIRQFLERKKTFILFGPTFPVVFERESPISEEMKQRRRRASSYLEEQGKGQ